MRTFFCLCLLLFLSNCNSGGKPAENRVARPDSLISEQRMILILTEIHMNEAALVYLRNHGKDTKILTTEYYNILFSKFRTSKKNFAVNLEYYQKDQENFLKMYDDVIKRLDTLSKGKQKRKISSEE